jgi:hypothetical protein
VEITRRYLPTHLRTNCQFCDTAKVAIVHRRFSQFLATR